MARQTDQNAAADNANAATNKGAPADNTNHAGTQANNPNYAASPANNPNVVTETRPYGYVAPYVQTPRNRVQWGPIWAGFAITLAMFLTIQALLIGVGAITVSGGTATTSTNNLWITAVVGLASFFVGGWVAGVSAVARGAADILQGFLVWALGVMAIIVASILGAGFLFGGVGNLIARTIFLGSGHTITGATISSYSGDIKTAALWGFFALIVSAVTAALGGWLGAASSPLGTLPGERLGPNQRP